MQNTEYQIVTPTIHQNSESMTFNTSLERKEFIQLERAKGWEIFLSYQCMVGSKELYSVARRKLS